MSGLSEREQAVAAWLAARREEMLALLGALVNADSPTRNKAAVDAAGELLKAFFLRHGLTVETRPSAEFGEAIRAVLPAPGANDPRPIVLLGHRDTVFADGEAGRRPFRIENGRAYGPGVADMKSGLVTNAFVIAALAATGGHSAPVVALVTSDEEIASPFSRAVIEAEARGARCVFNAEPSRSPNGDFAGERRQIITSGRKGGVFMRFEVTGRAAHSGAHYERGASAILEAARKVEALHALTDLSRGISVNVGLIGGGQTVNTIAPHAWGEIDLRYVKAPEREQMLERIGGIIERCSVPGTAASLQIRGEFLPLEETPTSRAMFELYRRAAADLGVEVSAEFTGGCADSGFTAAVGCPTLCSIGPAGGGGHTPEEFLEIDSLVPTAQALALAVLRIDSALGATG